MLPAEKSLIDPTAVVVRQQNLDLNFFPGYFVLEILMHRIMHYQLIQSFGSRINFHPHLHFLATEGGTNKQGQFHKVSNFNDSLLCRLFTREVFSLLLRKQLINSDLVKKILSWRHTGFNVHSKVRAESKEEAERPPPQAQLSMEEQSEYI